MSNMEQSSLSTVERKVEKIWREVLSIPRGGDELTFFELSGESISAVRIAAMVEEELGVSVEVGEIFETDPNLAAFARTVAVRLGER